MLLLLRIVLLILVLRRVGVHPNERGGGSESRLSRHCCREVAAGKHKLIKNPKSETLVHRPSPSRSHPSRRLSLLKVCNLLLLLGYSTTSCTRLVGLAVQIRTGTGWIALRLLDASWEFA